MEIKSENDEMKSFGPETYKWWRKQDTSKGGESQVEEREGHAGTNLKTDD